MGAALVHKIPEGLVKTTFMTLEKALKWVQGALGIDSKLCPQPEKFANFRELLIM